MSTQASPGLNAPSAYDKPQGAQPGVGLFVPNSNNASGDTLQAALSAARIPHNAVATNIGTPDSTPGRTILAGMSDGGRNGAGASPGAVGFDTLNSDSNGGQSLGAGGANQTEGPTSGQSNQAVGQVPATGITLPAVVNFGG